MSALQKVLVIDDEAPIRRFLKAILDPNDFELIEAQSGEEGMFHRKRKPRYRSARFRIARHRRR